MSWVTNSQLVTLNYISSHIIVSSYLCRSLSYNASMCRQMDGFKHSDGHCYFTPANCSDNSMDYDNCQCYRYRTTYYTHASCRRASTLTAFISTDDVITILPHADIIGTMGNATIEGSISTVQEIVDVEMECIVVRIVTAIIIIFNGYQ